jgi:hypothetical protein
LKARLVFEISRKDPRRLDVFLHIVNTGDQEYRWTTSNIADVHATLTDSTDHLVDPPGPMAVDIISSNGTYTLPGRSRLDLCISFDYGISTFAPANGTYRIQVGDGIWDGPAEHVGDYSLHVELSGFIGQLTAEDYHSPWRLKRVVLFDLPPQKIVITPRLQD